MTIYQIRKQLSREKTIQDLRKEYQEYTGETFKLIIKETKGKAKTHIEFGIEYWNKNKDIDGFSLLYDYWQDNNKPTKRFDYDFYYKMLDFIKVPIMCLITFEKEMRLNER